MEVIAGQRARHDAGHERALLAMETILCNTRLAGAFERGGELREPGRIEIDSELQPVVELAEIRVSGRIGAIDSRVEASDRKSGSVEE